MLVQAAVPPPPVVVLLHSCPLVLTAVLLSPSPCPPAPHLGHFPLGQAHAQRLKQGGITQDVLALILRARDIDRQPVGVELYMLQHLPLSFLTACRCWVSAGTSLKVSPCTAASIHPTSCCVIHPLVLLPLCHTAAVVFATAAVPSTPVMHTHRHTRTSLGCSTGIGSPVSGSMGTSGVLQDAQGVHTTTLSTWPHSKDADAMLLIVSGHAGRR
jgi:hypothetical protein